MRDGVHFASRIHLSAELTLPVARWIDMGHPRHVKVTVEPVLPDWPSPIRDDIAPHGA